MITNANIKPKRINKAQKVKYSPKNHKPSKSQRGQALLAMMILFCLLVIVLALIVNAALGGSVLASLLSALSFLK